MPVTISYAGLAPNFTGLYQFNVVIPNAPTGNTPLTFIMNGTAVPQALNIAVSN
jgi:uncharacterized protein (TIGR03437 family)